MTVLQRERGLILKRLSSNRFGDENWCLAVMKRLDAEYVPLNQQLPPYDAPGPAKANVEHVLPKNIPARSEWRRLSRANRSGHVHRIGNLPVLSRRDNDAVRNMDFKDKCKVYFAPSHTSPFARQSPGARRK